MRDALGEVQSVLVLGGGSEIGLAVARALAPRRAVVVHPSFTEPEAALRAAGHPVERLASERAPAFLAVLKRFGRERGMLSFPMPGWTLTMDLPAGRAGLAPFLDELDELVVAAGGRLYLAKDSRLRPELLERMYPELPRWRELQARLDPRGVLRSDLARRVGLLDAAPAETER